MADRPPSPTTRIVPRTATRVRQSMSDLVSQTSGLALITLVAAIFLAAAIGGRSIVGSLGTFGWIAYVVVLCVLALALGPVLASGVSIRRRGSARHREALRARVEAQRRRFALDSSPHTRRTQAELRALDRDPGR